jgi:hypothetical protein
MLPTCAEIVERVVSIGDDHRGELIGRREIRHRSCNLSLCKLIERFIERDPPRGHRAIAILIKEQNPFHVRRVEQKLFEQPLRGGLQSLQQDSKGNGVSSLKRFVVL